ncbi:MAG: hypothetical protein JSR55_12070, partial [Proteobacteria bacterium]|nr:hypothetical protein [Pseudomonadota bacterium]
MLNVWRWAAIAVVAIPGAALADAAQSTAFKLPSNVAVNITGGAANTDGTGLKSDTSVDIQTSAGETRLSGSYTTAPPNPALPADQTERKLGLDSTLNGPAGVTVSINASSAFQNTRQRGLLVPAGLSATSATTQQSAASASATAQPLPDVGVTMGVGQSRSLTAQDNQPVTGSRQRNTVTAGDRQAYASVDWAVIPAITLNAGVKSEEMRVSSRGLGNGADQYRYVEPSASATAQLWHGAQMKLGGEDAVSPVNPSDFAALAQADAANSALRVTPNREWRNEASLTQNLDNGGTLSATITRARIESTTELVLTPDGAAAPASVSGGTRQQLEANLSMPLSGIGLPDTTLSSQATLRQSRIRDPLTGQSRRVSGEAPHEAGAKLTHKDEAHHLEWGVTGNLATQQTFYQPAQVTALRTGSGVGAFVTYKPGKYVVSLNANGLIGSTRSQTDILYKGTRAGQVETI